MIPHSNNFTVKQLTCFFFIISISLIGCSRRDPKFQQYFVEGEQLYNKNCSNCHGKSGAGLGQLYPPLAGSDYMTGNFPLVVCMIKNGTKGEMIVNGIAYNQPMPGVPKLTPLEIAEITTYIYNSWGHQRGFIDVAQVEKSMTNCLAD